MKNEGSAQIAGFNIQVLNSLTLNYELKLYELPDICAKKKKWDESEIYIFYQQRETATHVLREGVVKV